MINEYHTCHRDDVYCPECEVERLQARVTLLESALHQIRTYSRQPNSMCVERWDLEVERREMRAIAKRALGILDKTLR